MLLVQLLARDYVDLSICMLAAPLPETVSDSLQSTEVFVENGLMLNINFTVRSLCSSRMQTRTLRYIHHVCIYHICVRHA